MMPNIIFNPLISRFALWWLRDLLLAQRTAAIVNMNTLKAGRTGLLIEGDALKTVESSLQNQVVAIEALLGIDRDDD
jgi:hypothetical protein